MILQVITNATMEDERALVDVSNKIPKLICRGDYYHDKIDEYIEGFLFCLDYNKIKYEKLNGIAIKLTDKETYYGDNAIINEELFGICEFCEE